MKSLESTVAFTALLEQSPLVLAYFTGGTCAACAVIGQAVEEIVAEFPQARAMEIPAAQYRALAASYDVFAVPTAILFVQGREALRFGRHVDLGDFRRRLARYHQLICDSCDRY